MRVQSDLKCVNTISIVSLPSTLYRFYAKKDKAASSKADKEADEGEDENENGEEMEEGDGFGSEDDDETNVGSGGGAGQGGGAGDGGAGGASEGVGADDRGRNERNGGNGFGRDSSMMVDGNYDGNPMKLTSRFENRSFVRASSLASSSSSSSSSSSFPRGKGETEKGGSRGAHTLYSTVASSDPTVSDAVRPLFTSAEAFVDEYKLRVVQEEQSEAQAASLRISSSSGTTSDDSDGTRSSTNTSTSTSSTNNNSSSSNSSSSSSSNSSSSNNSTSNSSTSCVVPTLLTLAKRCILQNEHLLPQRIEDSLPPHLLADLWAIHGAGATVGAAFVDSIALQVRAENR